MIEMRGLFFIGDLLFAENKFIVKEEVENHNNDGVEDKSTGGEDEFIGKR